VAQIGVGGGEVGFGGDFIEVFGKAQELRHSWMIEPAVLLFLWFKRRDRTASGDLYNQLSHNSANLCVLPIDRKRDKTRKFDV
jgi:hypothetical protein